MPNEPWRERPDQAAWRRKFGVLAPSTNSMVEYDFNSMNVPGVVPLFSRIHIYDADLSSPAQMEKLRVQHSRELCKAREFLEQSKPLRHKKSAQVLNFEQIRDRLVKQKK